LVLVEAHRVEDVELGLRPPVRDVGEPGLAQIGLGLARNVPRVARVPLTGYGVLHEAVDIDGGVLAEGVDVDAVRIRDEDHVGFLDLLESTDGRTVEPESLLEALRREL
jgi:hypothetical protein